tara:strand:- start:29 stop:718 length:690 start_codon:yes stop_codon:yes gene_type:complete
MAIAIIPARSKSKRIKNKNVKFFYNKPILEWTIQIIQSSNLFEEIIVSTDSKSIAKIAQKYGAQIPFYRPKYLSGDFVTTTKVIKHVIKKLKIKDKKICCIYPTAVLMHSEDLKKGFNLFNSSNFDYVFSATRHEKSVLRSFSIKSKKIKPIFLDHYKKRTQDLDSTFFDTGMFYWGKVEAWLNEKTMFSNKSSIIEIPFYRSIDIDLPQDWEKAEKIFKKYADKKLFK